MTPAHDIRGTVAGLRQWEECSARELLSSPWRDALGVWPIKGGFSTHPLHWRWTLRYLASGDKSGAAYGALLVTNDPHAWSSGSTIQDVELAHLLEAGELDRLGSTQVMSVLKRRGRGGHITWQMASGLEGRVEADQCGRRFNLHHALLKVGLELHHAEVRA